MKLMLTLLVLALSLACVMAIPQGAKSAEVVERQGKHGDGEWGGKRAGKECKKACFAHCLAGTTALVQDFCNLKGKQAGPGRSMRQHGYN